MKIEFIKCYSLTFFPQKKSENLRVLVGTSNGLVSRRECDVILAWRRQSEHRKSGPDYSTRSRILKCRSRSVAKSLYYLQDDRHLALLHRRRRRRRCRRSRRAYAPTSNTASHNNHEKINSWVSFSFLYRYGVALGGALL